MHLHLQVAMIGWPATSDTGSVLGDDEDGIASAAGCFSTPQLEQRLDLVQHLVEYSNQLIVVVGEQGAGKSTFAAELGHRARENWRVAQIGGHPDLSTGACIAALGTAFDLNVNDLDPERLRLDLLAQLGAYERADLIAVAMVDDAETLPTATLRTLLELAQPAGQAPRVHVVLLGEPALMDRLRDTELRGFRAEICHTLDLPAFTEMQTADFLGARYGGADAGLDIDAVQRIHAEAAGLPGRVAEIAARTVAGDGAKPERDAGIWPVPRPRPAHVVTGAIVLVLAALVLWSRTDRDSATPPAGVRIELPHPAAPPMDAPAPALHSPAGDETPEPAPGFTSGPAAPAIVVTPEAVVPEAVATAPAVTAEPDAPRAPTTPAAATPEPAPRAAPRESAPAGAHGPQWLAAQPGERYVLQLFGSHERAAAMKFLRDARLGDRGAWFTVTHEGKPWHVIVTGPFRNRAEAVAALAELPPRLRALKPWPRSIANIQAALK
ncbi:MAG: AAA family ATPase [Gammaproteobacteria bacterium]|nr:AAA family ATPase [Gammaproteobacteria bacterium]